MKQISLLKILFLCGIATVIGILLFPHPSIYAATDHIVISEIQVAGTTPSDEFIELYNPTSSPVIMNNWKIKKASSGGTITTLSTFSGTIPANGFFLLANDGYTATVVPDVQYASTMGDDNTIYLIDDFGLTVDRVGMGIAFDPEGLSVAQPPAGQSIERKAFASSTDVSMMTGDDVSSGNGFDSDNNSNDFILRTTNNPQNSGSLPELPPIPTPTPTEIPTPTPTDVPTPTPTIEPTATPIPLDTPTPTPSPTLIPTVTPTPSSIPTEVPTPTPTQELIITPTPTPIYQLLPTPGGYTWGQIIRKGRSYYCTVWFQEFIRRYFLFLRPAFKCTQPVPINNG